MEKRFDDRTCPHCAGTMQRWEAPNFNFSDGLGWGVPEMLVCFNNQCPIYVNGWNSMAERYGSIGSQRFFRNPFDGDQGVLPVGHKEALRGDIIEDAA